MILSLSRFASMPESTLGALSIDGNFCCFSIEDERREVKVAGETRIPAGTYTLALRTEGKLHEKYAGKFPEHRGMLWLQDVPGFEWIYIHVGNEESQTDGCILVGDTAFARGALGESINAYRRLYGQCLNALQAGEPVTIEVKDGTL
jgi:hypothetical protein